MYVLGCMMYVPRTTKAIDAGYERARRERRLMLQVNSRMKSDMTGGGDTEMMR